MATGSNDKYAITSAQGVIKRLGEILTDINLRLVQAESRYDATDRAAQEVAAQGLRYLETVIVPAATKVADLLRSVTDIFTTRSSSLVTPGTGPKTFVVTDSTFGSLGNVSVTKVGDSSVGMVGSVVSFDIDAKVLVVDVEYAYGDPSPNASWLVTATLPYDAHAGRTDNPHAVTAHQAGAYTQLEIDQKLAALSTTLRGTATAAGDTLGELEQRLIALIGTADSAGDTLGELEALITSNARRAQKKAIVFAAALG